MQNRSDFILKPQFERAALLITGLFLQEPKIWGLFNALFNLTLCFHQTPKQALCSSASRGHICSQSHLHTARLILHPHHSWGTGANEISPKNHGIHASPAFNRLWAFLRDYSGFTALPFLPGAHVRGSGLRLHGDEHQPDHLPVGDRRVERSWRPLTVQQHQECRRAPSNVKLDLFELCIF